MYEINYIDLIQIKIWGHPYTATVLGPTQEGDFVEIIYNSLN